MNPALGHMDLARFGAAVAARIGLDFDETRFGFLGEVLARRLAALGRTPAAYLARLEAGDTAEELGALARELTVGETYFFRNREQFQALAEIVLPERRIAAAGGDGLRLLSAGCASGEEAYSLAIVARETIVDPASVTIRAVDINPAALEQAAAAHYSPWALRETPPEMRRKWFRGDGRHVVLAEAVRSAVGFAQRNLLAPDPELWPPGHYDVVFCRNVIMYFTPAQARALIARVAASLRPGGYLFLGHAETLRGVAEGFCLCHTHGTFYYRLDWRDSCRTIAAPVRKPAEPVSAAPQPRHPATAPTPAPDMPAVRAALPTGRVAEALASVRARPPEAAGETEALLAEAMVLADGDRLAVAEAACRRLLAVDPRNAGAHYVLALCRERAGDCAGAAEHDREASALAPEFAMPRLHLGLVARRAGDRVLARGELGQALVLLQGEDGTRLSLFGGGFPRDTLVALCRAALRECGGAP